MLGLGELAVRVANLAEAEGRVARRALVRLAVGLLTLTVAFALALAGIAMLAVSAVMGLGRVMPMPAAIAIVGAILLLLAWAGSTHAHQFIDDLTD